MQVGWKWAHERSVAENRSERIAKFEASITENELTLQQIVRAPLRGLGLS